MILKRVAFRALPREKLGIPDPCCKGCHEIHQEPAKKSVWQADLKLVMLTFMPPATP